MLHFLKVIIIYAVFIPDISIAQQTENELPSELICSEESTRVKRGFLIAAGTATADDATTAIKKAVFNARNELAQQLQITITAATQHHIIITEVNDSSLMVQNFTNRISTVVNQSLSGIAVVCQRADVLASGQYKASVVVELDSGILLGYMQEVLSTDTLSLNNLKSRWIFSE
jgi:hypothetical protein